MKRFFNIFLVFVCLLSVVACNGKKTNNGDGGGAKLIEEVSQEIHAEEGGKIEAETKDEAVSIEIPAGALDEDVKITMKIYDAKGYKGTEGLDVLSKVVEFEPSGTVFKKPVIITMKALKDVGSVSESAKNKVITAAVYRDEKGAWSYSPTGEAVKISGRSEGGDPIMTNAAGDPIMLNAAGDPIMMPSSGGDPIMLSAAGDPIMVTAVGDPIMSAAAGDPIMMTTGHFSSYAFLIVGLENEADVADIDNDDSDSDTAEADDDEPLDDTDTPDDEITDIDDNDDTDDSDSDTPEPDDTDTEPEESDPCAGNPCEDAAHSDGVCSVEAADGVKTYACGCEDPYSWDGSKCSSVCAEDPCSTVYHSNGICYPKPDGKYECGCAQNYYWDASAKKCSNPCTADPCGSVQYATGCVPTSGSEYVCSCEDNYAWNGSKCLNPCDSVPCAAFEYATECTTLAYDFYSCGCEAGYYWWGTAKGCTEEKPVFGRICTSQFKCFDNHNEIPCPSQGEPFYGQDANKAREGLCAPKSFTIVDTGIENEDIVRDNNTGLEWMKSLENDKDFKWSDAKHYCSDLEYGGHDDWRVPSPKEYLSIVDNGRSYPTMDTRYFDAPQPYGEHNYINYNSWTSVMDVHSEWWYWAVGFDDGSLDDIADNSTRFVRCVRGEALPESEFIIPDEYAETEEKIVVDTLTGLQWQYHDADIADYVDFWKDALFYCENLVYAGHDDWRLPNKDELMTLVDFTKYAPASAFPDIQPVDYLLTSTTIPDNSRSAFRLYLPRGGISTTMTKSSDALNSVDYHVHCVRSDD